MGRVYHASLASRDIAQQFRTQDLTDKVELIINAQQMMSLRLDIIDYETGLSSDRPKELITPFPKVDKVLRCFKGKLSARRISYRIDGRNRDQIFGPPIFEIVPFVIVENAVKYAPFGSEIVVRFHEEEGKLIIRFDSLGPEITKREREKIFEKDYRGESVQQSGRTGSGIGLFAAKTIIENHFDGKIFVNQLEPVKWIDGQRFWNTRFTVVLPSYEAEKARR